MNELADGNAEELSIDWNAYDTDPDYCCNCGHYHGPFFSCPDDPSIPCGDRRCCVN